MTADYLTQPIDPTSAAALTANGIRLDTLRVDDKDGFETWFQAVSRGFHQARADQETIDPQRESFAARRMTGAWDDTLVDAAYPIATTASWVSAVTVSGGKTVPTWAISDVTVASTHRRRGIARNLLESELRTAAALDIPIAMLTASEATIYGRFGFAPSANITRWTVQTKRATWTGPKPTGRVQLVPTETIRDGGGFEILERARLQTPGLVHFDGILWTRLFGLKGMLDPDKVRVLRYDDADGAPQGFVIYTHDDDQANDISWVQVRYFAAATDDAYAAMWRYLFEIDLIDEVRAGLRPVVEPFQWQISDARAATKKEEGDHLWLRILDVARSLEGRSYSAPGVFVLDVTDPLGFAEGSYLLEIATSGEASVRRLDETGAYDDNHRLALSINDLAAIYLGAVSVGTLVHAGRITEVAPGSATAADAAFRSEVTPYLSIWF